MNATLNRAMRDNMTEARSFSESSEVSFNLSVLEITDIAEDKYNSKLTAGGDYVVAAYVLLNSEIHVLSYFPILLMITLFVVFSPYEQIYNRLKIGSFDLLLISL